MPPLERKTFGHMASGLISDTIAFVKVRVEGATGRIAPPEYIIYKAELARDSSLRHEAENNRHSDDGSRYYADAGNITLGFDGTITVDGDPSEVLDVPTMPRAKDPAEERRNTIALIQTVAGNWHVTDKR